MIVNADARNFSSTVVDAQGKTVVQFHATWCGPCKALAPHFEAASQRNEEVNWVKADVDQLDPTTLSEYGIMSVPRVILFENGEPVRDIKARTVYGILEEVND